ncbi:MAG: hypothetical protein GY724_16985 [Actinomycetia bacterium]|nr:hypothetical protein [Actinomycetes bacterium]MCP5030494.1 hypothetical protein [Actinomycetes bacterium]
MSTQAATNSASASTSVETSTRRINAAAKLLAGIPHDVVRILDRLDQDELANVGEVVRQLQRQRAMDKGELEAIIANAFEVGFGRDGLGTLPWVEGDIIVCPGGLVSKSRTSHRCRFVSVDDTWIWESGELLREDKRSSPGAEDGFRAVALLPLVDGLALDVVSGKARSGQHSVDRVISYEVRARELVEVSQRIVAAAGMK